MHEYPLMREHIFIMPKTKNVSKVGIMRNIQS